MALTTIEPFGINSSNTFTFGGVTATGNVTANNVTVGNTVSVTGNVTGNFFIGNGSQLTGLPESYSNANVEAYLPTYTGNLVSLTGNVTTTANISANYVLGNGSQLTGLPESYSNANVAAYLPTYSGNISADNITATTFTGNISGGSNTAGTVTASAQPNITSVGTLTSVSVSGNIDGGNIAGNGAGLTSITGANVTGQVPNALVSGTVYTAAQPNITSVGTLTSLSSSGNITGAYILGNGSQLTGLPESYTNANVAAYLPTYTGNLASLEGNVTTTANVSASYVLGNGSALTSLTGANVTGQVPNALVSGTVTTAAQPNITSVGTLSSLSVTSNITGGNIVTAGLVDAGTLSGNGAAISAITGANVTGQVANAQVSGTVYTAAQPNITSVGTLSSLSVSGNITGGNISTAGHAAAATLQTTGNAIIGGDLVVNGNTIQVNIDQLNVQDPIIGLGRGANNAPLTTNDGRDRGTEMWYYTDAEQSAFVGYQNSTGNIIAASNVSMANEIVTVNSYGNFVTGNVIGATVSASGNISGAYILGNGSQLTGLPEGYANADVAAYLPTYTGNLVSLQGNVTTTANISGAYVLGNGSALTGLPVPATTTFSATAPVSPAQGDIWIDADSGIQYIYFNDGTSSQWAEMEAQTSVSSGPILSAITESIVPAADVTYDLGSATYRWRDIYLSGNTINLGGATIKTDAGSGAIALIPEPTESNPNPSGMVVSPTGGITVVATTGGEVSGNAIANAAASPTAAPVPIDITTTPPTDGQALIWDAANEEFVPGNVATGGSAATVYGNIASLPLSNVATGTMAFVSSNNRLYLWNGTGWFNIALINTNPTITGGADPTYTFATDGTPIVLTLTASDPEGIPLTWSYQVTSGSLGDTATVSQADNVFTVTPSTDAADAGVFELTFSASDGVNVGTAASTFTLRFSAADPYYQQSVLLSTTATNNGTNNTFVDSSTNNATVTRYANTTQGAFGAFSPAGWSGYFDGTGDYLSATVSTSLNVSANTDFTVEGWCYLTARTATRPAIFSNYNSFTTGGLSFWAGHGSSTTTQFQVGLNGTFPALNAGTIPYNSWFHWAIVRNGTSSNNITVYINGTSIGTISSNVAITTTGNNLWLGASGDAVANAGINGYMSNFRWVTGTALYTANFTPPTEPLTAVSGTSLLTLQSNRFVDNSANNFTITRNGDARITPFSPFSPTTPYVTASNGGSGYFDGTGDYLSVPYSTSAFDWWTTNYTIEAWVYPTSFTGWSYSDGGNIKPTLIGNKKFNTTEHYWGFGLNTSGNVYFAYYNGSSQGAGSSGTATLNAWNHIAVVVNGGTITLYLNGVGTSIGTVGGSPLSSASVPLTIGAANNAYINGYVSGLRVVKGTAVYTSNFTPPTAPPTAIANTSLLLNFVNANIYDQTGKVDLETVGDAKTSTAVVKYGSTSMVFDGTGDYLKAAYSNLWDLRGDFTIECWLYFTAHQSYGGIVSCSNPQTDAAPTAGWAFVFYSSTNKMYFEASGVGIQATNVTPSGQWNHVAVVRSGTTITHYLNGIANGSGTSSAQFIPQNTNPLVIGSNRGFDSTMTGYISDLRITNGVARYTTNFTPPTAQLGYSNPE